jgi:hypothetical protein
VSAADVVWRTAARIESHGAKVPFVKVEAAARRLDELAGPENWQTAYTSTPVANEWSCRLSLRVGAEWLARDGVGVFADDAFVAAAESWGIGRYLRRVSSAEDEALPSWALPTNEQGSAPIDSVARGESVVPSAAATAPATTGVASEPRADVAVAPVVASVASPEVQQPETPIEASVSVNASSAASEASDAATGNASSSDQGGSAPPADSVSAPPPVEAAELPVPQGVDEQVLVLMHEVINRGNNGVNITSLRNYAKKKKDQGVFNDEVLAYVTAGLDKAEQKQKAAA